MAASCKVTFFGGAIRKHEFFGQHHRAENTLTAVKEDERLKDKICHCHQEYIVKLILMVMFTCLFMPSLYASLSDCGSISKITPAQLEKLIRSVNVIKKNGGNYLEVRLKQPFGKVRAVCSSHFTPPCDEMPSQGVRIQNLPHKCEFLIITDKFNIGCSSKGCRSLGFDFLEGTKSQAPR